MTPIGTNLTTIGLPDGEHGYRAAIDFSVDENWRVDFNSFQNQGWQVRSLYVDNSQNSQPIVLVFSASGQRVDIQAGYQQYVPVLQNQAEFVEVSSIGSEAVVPVFFLERYRVAASWASSTGVVPIVIEGLNFLPDDEDNVAPLDTDFFLAVINRNTVYDPVGNNWDRMRGDALGIWVQGPVADGTALAGAGKPQLIAGQDGANIQSVLTDNQGRLIVNINGAIQVGAYFPDDVDNVAAVATNTFLGVLSRNTVWDAAGGNWDRLRGNATGIFIQGALTPSDALTTPTDAIDTRSFLELFNGATNDRARNNSAANISAATQQFNISVAYPAQWTGTDEPGGGVQPVYTKAAGGAGVRHVAQAYMLSATNSAGITGNRFYVRNGASGVGPIIWRDQTPGSVAGAYARCALSGLEILGSANTAMTFESNGGGAVTLFQVISAAGYSTV